MVLSFFWSFRFFFVVLGACHGLFAAFERRFCRESHSHFDGGDNRQILLYVYICHMYIYMVQSCWSMGPPPREGGRVTTPRPPLWYCGTSRVSWQSSRQQNMFQINNKYTTPAPPCGTVVLLECRGKQVDSRTCSK